MKDTKKPSTLSLGVGGFLFPTLGKNVKMKDKIRGSMRKDKKHRG